MRQRVPMRWTMPTLALALLLAAASGCDRDQNTPENTVRSFLKAAMSGEREEVFALLVPAEQQRLRAAAKRAEKHTGKKLRPHELLATSLARPRRQLARVELVEQAGDRAKVKLFDTEDKHSEVWQLQRIDGRWRIALPTH